VLEGSILEEDEMRGDGAFDDEVDSLLPLDDLLDLEFLQLDERHPTAEYLIKE
jgi:hypothetical protein